MKKLLIKLILLILLIIIILGSIFGVTGYVKYSSALKEQPIKAKVDEIRKKDNYTKLDEMTKFYKNAVISVEDHRFYEHSGVDVWSVMRAILNNMRKKELAEGGSTITQQLSKNTYFTQNREITRKVAECFMAWKYEKTFSKDEILELYLNTSYFGDGYYTVKEAALGYFEKMPSELNEYEASMLAGIPNAPSVYSPTVNFELASQRQRQVLEEMVKYGYITEENKEDIIAKKEQYRSYFNDKKK